MVEPIMFTAGDVKKLVGVSQRQLTHWDQTALLHPSGRAAHGRGSRRLYTLLDVLQLKLVRRLRETGLSLQKIRAALRYLANLPDEPAPVAELEILTDGKRILIRRSDEQILDPLARQFVLRLSLADLLAEVRDDNIVRPLQSTQHVSARQMSGLLPT
jgi:DNA-binding transcriptional MerR regulator